MEIEIATFVAIQSFRITPSTPYLRDAGCAFHVQHTAGFLCVPPADSSPEGHQKPHLSLSVGATVRGKRVYEANVFAQSTIHASGTSRPGMAIDCTQMDAVKLYDGTTVERAGP